MLSLSPATRIFLAVALIDGRMSFNGLTALVQGTLEQEPTSGFLFVFVNRARNRLKILFWDGSGLVLYTKRLERGRFIWPNATEGSVHLSGAQLSMLLEGIDWRRPSRTWQPERAG